MCDLFGGDDEQKTTQTQISNTSSGPERWVREEGRRIYDSVVPFAQRSYPGTSVDRLVAGFTPDQMSSFEGVRSTQGNWQPNFSAATAGAGSAMQRFPNADVGAYMSPFINNVIDQLRYDRDVQANQARAQAGAANAFGDSSDVLERGLNESFLRTAGALRNTGYEQARAQYNADMARRLQAAQTLGQLGSEANRLGYADAEALFRSGLQQQQQQQQRLTARRQEELAGFYYPQEQAQWLQAMLRTTPFTQEGSSSGTTTTIAQQPQISPFQAAIGLGSTALGLGGMAFGGPAGMNPFNAVSSFLSPPQPQASPWGATGYPW